MVRGVGVLVVTVALACDEPPMSRPPAPTEVGPLDLGEVFGFDEVATSAADGAQSQAAVAWNGTTFLVAWIDQQSGVRAARVGLDGIALDEPPLTLGPRGNLRTPTASCSGDVCAVAWVDLAASDGRQLQMVRLAANGSAIDSSPLTFVGYWPGLGAYDGGFLLSSNDNGGVFAVRVGLSGEPLDPTPIEVSTGSQLSNPRLGCDAAGCLVAVTTCEPGSPCVARVFRIAAGDGTVTPPGGTMLPALAMPLAVARGPSGYLVVDAGYEGVQGVLVDPTGTPTSEAFTIFAPATSGTGAFVEVAAAADVDGFVVTALQMVSNETRLVAKRVAFDGTVAPGLPVDLLPAFYEQMPPAFACATTRCLAAATVATFESDVVLTRLEGTVRLDDPPLVPTHSANRQWFPAAASNGVDYLVVWSDVRQTGAAIRAARLSGVGPWIDEASIEVAPVRGWQTWPTVAWTGESYLVVWSDLDGLYGTRVSTDGRLLDPTPSLLRSGSLSSGTPHGASCHEGACVLTFEEEGHELAILLDPSAQPTGGEVALGPSSSDRAQIAFNAAADLFGAVWVGWDEVLGDRVLVGRIRANGEVVGGPVDITGETVAYSAGYPAITAVGEAFVVAWTADWVGRGDEWDVGFRVLDRDASPRVDPAALAASSQVETSPMVASFGDHALLAWHAYDASSQGTRLAGQRVNADGVLLDTAPLDFGAVAKLSEPILVAGLAGHALLIWEEYVGAPFDAVRLRLLPLVEATSP